MFASHAFVYFFFLLSLAFPPLLLVSIPLVIWRIVRTIRMRRLYKAAQGEVRDMARIAYLASYGGKR